MATEMFGIKGKPSIAWREKREANDKSFSKQRGIMGEHVISSYSIFIVANRALHVE